MKILRKYYIRIRYIKNELKIKVLSLIQNQKVKNINNQNKKIFIFLAADYGNLGDVAITYAQKMYLQNLFSKHQVIEIPLKETYKYVFSLKKYINKDDIITIVGGGNMTNRYDGIEEARRQVIKNLKKNKIVSFPQTIEFTNDIYGQESLRRTKKIYSKHNNLTIVAREKKSYDIMKKIFNQNNVIMTPDIVMSLEKIKNDRYNRSQNIGICLRNDKEKLLDEEFSIKFIKKIEKHHNLEFFDTHIGDNNFNYNEREKVLKELLKKISNMKLVITDRLHGMIFCYITNTPCIVFDNDNHKIEQTYKTWLKNCNYIKFYEKMDINNIDINSLIDYNFEEPNIDFSYKFESLKNVLLLNSN